MTRRLAHLSDLHFGAEDPTALAGLQAALARIRPHLVVVSGDLTQRARRPQFAAAHDFLEGLGVPWLAVPGNHDLPLLRGLRPWRSAHDGFLRAIGPREPTFADDELAVLGLDTTSRYVWKGGFLRTRQLARVRSWAEASRGRILVVAAHHPLAAPPEGRGHSLVRGWRAATRALEECGVDVALTGHHHIGGHSESRAFVAGGPRRLVVMQAGTAVSRRVRGTPNSFNVLTLDARAIQVEPWAWDGRAFQATAHQAYPRHGAAWEPESPNG